MDRHDNPAAPDHDGSIYVEVSTTLSSQAQPTVRPLPQELDDIRTVIKLHANKDSKLPSIEQRELFGLFGVLMQFMSYTPNPKLRPYCPISFDQTEQLYLAITRQGHDRKKRLGLAAQLQVALEQTAGDIPEALWRLFITSRLYARWFDTSIVDGIPVFTRQEILRRMTKWSSSISAFKPAGSGPYQDASGDVYYCWTHAIAKLLYGPMAKQRKSLRVRAQRYALHHGTWLNHQVAQRYNAQRLPSDHTIAATYGNAIGDMICTELLHRP